MWLYSKISPCENNACTYVLTLLGGNLSMTSTLSYSFNKTSYFSQITLYVEHAVSDTHPPLGFHCIHGISSYNNWMKELGIKMLTCHNGYMFPKACTENYSCTGGEGNFNEKWIKGHA